VCFENRADRFDFRGGRWRDEQRRQRGVIAVQLLLDDGIAAPRADRREKHALLHGDVPQQSAAECLVARLLDAAVSTERCGQQSIETLVIAAEELV
jgi:hypothetical protein